MSSAKDFRITIRLKPEEHAQMQAKVGSKALSAFVRETVLEQAAQRRKPTASKVSVDQKATAQILALLGRHRVVQAVKCAAAEDGALSDPDLVEDVKTGRALLESVRGVLMQALARTYLKISSQAKLANTLTSVRLQKSQALQS